MSVQLLFHHVTSFVQIDQDPISVVVLVVDMTYLMATDAEVSKNKPSCLDHNCLLCNL